MALSVPNIANWTSYFSQTLIKNCGISFYDSNSNLIANQNNIIEYKYNGHSCIVGIKYPQERVSVKLDYNSLSANQKTWLVKGAFYYFYYKVENTTTTTKKYFFLQNIKIDRKSEFADLEFIGILETLTSLIDFEISHSDLSQYKPNPTLILDPNLKDLFDGCVASLPNYINKDNSFLATNITYPYLPPQISKGELLQEMSLLKSGNICYKDGYVKVSSIDFANYVAYGLNNIHSFEYDSDEETQISGVYGYSVSEVSNSKIMSWYKRTGLGFNDYYVLDNQVGKIIGANCYYIDSNNNKTGFNSKLKYYGSELEVEWEYRSDLPSTFPNSIELFWNNVEITNKKDCITLKSISNGLILTHNTYNKVNGLLSKNEFVNTKGRLDPRIELLDLVAFNNLLICVEELKINFNGGFSGEIKGRILDEVSDIDDPVILRCEYNDEQFVVDVQNPNYCVATLKVVYSAGTLSFAVGSIVELNNATAPALLESFQRKYENTLQDDVYCYLEVELVDGAIIQSDNVIIIEAD